MFYNKNVRLIVYSICFWNVMQGMDAIKELLGNIKYALVKFTDTHSHSVEEKFKNIQQNQYIPIPDEKSIEEESSTEEETQNQRISTKNQGTQYFDEEKEMKALQQLLNCHKIIASV